MTPRQAGWLLVKVLAPLIAVGEVVVRNVKEGAAGGRRGHLNELHVGLPGGPARFTAVAVNAGADDILPGVLPSSEAGYNVVEGKVAALLAAVLAGVLVPVEYLVAGHLALAVRPADKLPQADNGGKLYSLRERVDITEAVLYHLRFALVDKDDGAAGAADGQRFVTLVQN